MQRRQPDVIIRDGKVVHEDTRSIAEHTDAVYQLEQTRPKGTRRTWTELHNETRRKMGMAVDGRTFAAMAAADTATLEKARFHLSGIPDTRARVHECERICRTLGRAFKAAQRADLCGISESRYKHLK